MIKIAHKISLTLVVLLLSFHSQAQNNWILISPPNSYLNFNLPDNPTASSSTANLKSYTYVVNPDISLNCVLMIQNQSFLDFVNANLSAEDDSMNLDSSQSLLLNPLPLYKIALDGLWENDTISDVDTSFYNQSLGINGIEFKWNYFDNSKNRYSTAFIRAYYNGQDLVTFCVEGAQTMIEDLIDYKSTYFNSIAFNNE